MSNFIEHAGRHLAIHAARHPRETAEAIGAVVITAAPYALPIIAVAAVGVGVAYLVSESKKK